MVTFNISDNYYSTIYNRFFNKAIYLNNIFFSINYKRTFRLDLIFILGNSFKRVALLYIYTSIMLPKRSFNSNIAIFPSGPMFPYIR
jgi:hypothetical protein